jgi:hypothetical protein
MLLSKVFIFILLVDFLYKKKIVGAYHESDEEI